MQNDHARLIVGEQEYELNLLSGTFEDKYIDIETLYAKTGIRTFDPSFKSTTACRSDITYINGEKGILLYRGYPIEELAEKRSYLEVSYLLFHGELPNEAQYQQLKYEVSHHTLVHEQLRQFYNGFRRDAHPMAIMCGVIGALSAFYHDSLNIYDAENRRFSAIRLLAKVPTIAAMCFKYSIGQPFLYPHPEYSYVENFLHMLFGIPNHTTKPSPLAVKALETILILHADHEQNASTSTVRLAGSSGANPFACIAAGIAALWGPAHGGANEAVIKMLEEIGDVTRIPLYINKAKDKTDSFKLMGFGHRVYKNFDPRAKIIKKLYEQILEESGHSSDPLFDIAKELERIALNDEYFIERKLYPNVDFYSGLILKRLGIPTEMFTVIFVVARVIGWISQWNEMLSHPPLTIGRPQQLYTGSGLRHDL